MTAGQRIIDRKLRSVIARDRAHRTEEYAKGSREKELPPVTLPHLKFMEGPGPEEVDQSGIAARRDAELGRRAAGMPAGASGKQDFSRSVMRNSKSSSL